MQEGTDVSGFGKKNGKCVVYGIGLVVALESVYPLPFNSLFSF